MGFPVGYSEFLFPKLLLHLIFFLSFLRRFIEYSLTAAGLGHLIDSESPWPDPSPRTQPPPELSSASAVLIQEILPVVRFDELLRGEGEGRRRPVADCCAVCLYEFEDQEEVRRLRNCRHVFHRGCLDRWVDHDQRTCPLCRTPLIPEEMQEAFDRRVWDSSSDPDPYAAAEFESSPSSVLLPPPGEAYLRL